METISSLPKKSESVQSVAPNDTVAMALQKMADFNLGAILVIDRNQISGIFSERDYARKILLQGKSSLTTPVFEVMNPRVIYVTPDYTLEECLALMTSKKMRHLPVIENTKLLSVITMEDVVAALIEDQVFYINELTKYVTGSLMLEEENSPHHLVRELVNSDCARSIYL